MENEKEDVIEIDLLRLLGALWHKAYVLVLAAFAVGTIFFVNAAYFTAPVYQADVFIYVNNSSISLSGGNISISPGELQAAQSLADVYAFIIKSRTTLNEVINTGNLDYTYEELSQMVTASIVDEMEIIKVSVQSDNPKEAEHIANITADVLPDAIAKIVDGSSVRIIDYAVVPKHKISPDITRNTIMGMMLGFILSAGLVIVMDLMDDRIKSKEFLLKNYDIPVLTTIPNMGESSVDESVRTHSKGRKGGYESSDKKKK